MPLYIFERWVENGLLANAVTTVCLQAGCKLGIGIL